MSDALLSIHDCMPETLADVAEQMELAAQSGLHPITLLVVPGRDWSQQQLDQLRQWQADGHELAGHGWSHRCSAIGSWQHRIHSLLLSRNVAEHLSLPEDQRVDLMHRCADWFIKHHLDIPRLYVPPAWALGKIASENLQQIPFQMVETLTGVLDIRSLNFRRLPLIGFEADTALRSIFLRGFNACNCGVAKCYCCPLRISLHPSDHRLRLSDQVLRLLQQKRSLLSYEDLFSPAACVSP